MTPMAPIDEAREKALILMAAINPRFAMRRKEDPAFQEREVGLISYALLAAYEAGTALWNVKATKRKAERP